MGRTQHRGKQVEWHIVVLKHKSEGLSFTAFRALWVSGIRTAGWLVGVSWWLDCVYHMYCTPLV